MLNRDLLRRYRRVVPINEAAGQWNKQVKNGAGHFYPEEDLTEADLHATLTQRYWVGSRAPADGHTDRVAFDIDCTAMDRVQDRDNTYWAIRHLFGVQRVPLVYGTPSGLGLRVVYCVPRMPLTNLVTGARTGLVADVLRGAGLYPRLGYIEIFPRTTQADRLMLGRRMPLLDPGTLLPLAHAAISDTFDEEILRQALEEVEVWHAKPLLDLLDHLGTLPRRDDLKLICNVSDGTDDSVLLVDGAGKITVSPAIRALIKDGLTGPNMRFRSEWTVGLAFVGDPRSFAEYGLGDQPTDHDVARALALWLSEKHNGHSGEWTLSHTRQTSLQGAIGYWTNRYLARGADGTHLVGRLARALCGAMPSKRRVRQLSREECTRLFAVAERHYEPEARRYHFECWLFAWQRMVKEIIDHHTMRGKPPKVYALTSQRCVYIEIAAMWMEHWPYGSGRTRETGRKSRYLEFKEKLAVEELLIWAAPFANPRKQWPGAPRDIAGTAIRYRTPLPDMHVCVADIPVAPWVLKTGIEGLRASNGRSLTLDEAYHALWATELGFDLVKRYGRRTAERIRGYVAEITKRASLAVPSDHTVRESTVEIPLSVHIPSEADAASDGLSHRVTLMGQGGGDLEHTGAVETAA